MCNVPIVRCGDNAEEWPSTPEIDDFVWDLGPEPSEEDARWAAENLNHDDWQSDEPLPDDHYDRLAEEAEAQSRHESGLLF